MDKTIVVKFDDQFAPEITKIRNDVFTVEQHIDENLNLYSQDQNSVHVLVIHKEKYVGTGRMLKDGHLGRLAVLRKLRGRGLGVKVVLALVGETKNIGLKRIYLDSQKHAVGFYQKLGFTVYGEPYTEANIEHIHMERFI